MNILKNTLKCLFVLAVIIGCGNSNDPTPTPISIRNSQEAPRSWNVILSVYEESYNKNGYVILGVDSEDKYGRRLVPKSPMYIFEHSVVIEMKKYASAIRLYTSDYGLILRYNIDVCDDSTENGKECYIRAN